MERGDLLCGYWIKLPFCALIKCGHAQTSFPSRLLKRTLIKIPLTFGCHYSSLAMALRERFGCLYTKCIYREFRCHLRFYNLTEKSKSDALIDATLNLHLSLFFLWCLSGVYGVFRASTELVCTSQTFIGSKKIKKFYLNMLIIIPW